MQEEAPTTVSIRVSPKWLKRLDALIPFLNEDPDIGFRVTRSSVTRHALLRGMGWLEFKYKVNKKKPKTRRS